MANKKIVVKITKAKSGQRRLTIPNSNKTLKEGDLVEVIKIKFK